MQGWEVTERQPKMDLRAELATALGGDPSADHVLAWLDESRTENTKIAYARDVMLYVRWLARRCELAAVDRRTVSAYGAHVRSLPLANATMSRRIAAVSSMYDFLAEMFVIEHNPAAKVRRPRVSRAGRTPARAKDEMGRVFAVATPRDMVLVGLMYVAALRVTEVARASVSDLRTEKGRRLLFVRTKGDKTRDVPIPPVLCAYLDAYLDGRQDGPLLLNDDGVAFTRDQVLRTLRRLAVDAHLEDPARLRPHVMRASAITRLLVDGKHLHDVREMVGHSSADTTERYYRRAAGHDRDADLTDHLSDVIPPMPQREDEAS